MEDEETMHDKATVTQNKRKPLNKLEKNVATQAGNAPLVTPQQERLLAVHTCVTQHLCNAARRRRHMTVHGAWLAPRVDHTAVEHDAMSIVAHAFRQEAIAMRVRSISYTGKRTLTVADSSALRRIGISDSVHARQDGQASTCASCERRRRRR